MASVLSTGADSLVAFARTKLAAAVDLAQIPVQPSCTEAVEKGQARIVCEALPLRLHVYDLNCAGAQFGFYADCRSPRSSGQLLEAAAVQLDGRPAAYYLYSLASLPLYPDRRDVDELPGAPYDVAADWTRLLGYVKEHDVALELLWLRLLYEQGVARLFAVLNDDWNRKQELVETQVFLADATFGALAEDTLRRQGGLARIKPLREFLQSSMWRRPKPRDLRSNPLIAALFALQSPLFHSFALTRIQELFDRRFASTAIAKSHVDQLVDFYNFVVDYDAAAARRVAEIAYMASLHTSDGELEGYATYNFAAILANTPGSAETAKAEQFLRRSRALFEVWAPDSPALPAIRAGLQRLRGLKRATDGTMSLTPEQWAEFAGYNVALDARDFDKALSILDHLRESVAAENPARIDFDALAGGILLGQNRLHDAHKRYYRCQAMIEDGITSRNAYFDLFEISILRRSDKLKEAIEKGLNALARIRPISETYDYVAEMANSIAACQCELARYDDALELIREYEPLAGGRQKLYLQSNRALAYIGTKQYEAAVDVCSRLLDRNAAEGDPPLEFDLRYRIADALALSSGADGSALDRALACLNDAERFVEFVEPGKRNAHFYLKAAILERRSPAKRTGWRIEIEKAFHAAEAEFEAMRQHDNVEDRDRLITGLNLKIDAFWRFLVLFPLYVAEQDWLALYDLAQRYKSRFLAELFFANSENMIAERPARRFLKSRDAGAGLATMLLGLLDSAEGGAEDFEGPIPAAGRATPISYEHSSVARAMVEMEKGGRAEWMHKARQQEFLDAHLTPRTVVVEFFLLSNTRVGALVVRKGQPPQLLGTYECAGLERPFHTLRPHAFDRAALDVASRNFEERYAALGRDLHSLADTADDMVLCPSAGLWNIPLHAVRADGEPPLGSRIRICYAPSATIHALCRARRRTMRGNGFALIAPQGDLPFADDELAAILQGDIPFPAPRREDMSMDALKQAAADSHWIHIAAHGRRGEFGWDTAIGTGPSKEHDLSAIQIFLDCFPGIASSVVVLSACSSADLEGRADEPVGLPTLLLTSGARCVIAPQWEVDDFSTSILMRHFYGRLRASGSVSASLLSAQGALRSLTTEHVLRELESASAKARDRAAELAASLRAAYLMNEHPFASPFFWAPFTTFGTDVRSTPLETA